MSLRNVIEFRNGKASPGAERRAFTVGALRTVRTEGKAPKIEGHASVFNQVADIGWFREQVAPGAFAQTLQDDVRALINHDPNYVLGRTVAGTLRLSEDSKGLAISIDPPDTQAARDLMVSMERGDINQMSIGFQAVKETWDETDPNSPLRTLLQIRLFDVSPVTFPAFTGTDVAVRSSYDAFRASQKSPVDLRRLKMRVALAARA